MECIRPDVDAQLLRITVETPEKDAYVKTNAIRVVVWRGPRREVWEQGVLVDGLVVVPANAILC